MTKYLCIDDEDNSTVRTYLRAIRSARSDLKISFELPKRRYSKQIEDIRRRLLDEEFQGLILDLRLDGDEDTITDDVLEDTGETSNDKEEPIETFRAPELAQRVRNRSSEIKPKQPFPICPIVLWSTDERLEVAYAPDDTSHDLFDLKIFKSRLPDELESADDLNDPDKLDPKKPSPYAVEVANQLVALSDGYKELVTNQTQGRERAQSLLKIPEGWIELLDPSLFETITEQASIHRQARFIIRELLSTSNTGLITSEIAAARIGLLPNVKGLNEILEVLFPKAKYTGIFSEGWQCWWAPIMADEWLAYIECPGPLHLLSAGVRVEFIKKITGRQDLEPAQPLRFTTSTNYWSVCKATDRPIDPVDGFLTNRSLQSWQLTEYVSLWGFLNKKRERAHVQLASLERQRFEDEKSYYLKGGRHD